MTLVVLGLDALDPDLVDPDSHPDLVLDCHREIETITSSTGEPSTHELWPTIITGLTPPEHGIELGSGGVGWSNPWLRFASSLADHLVPDPLQRQFGAWILNNTQRDAFRIPATYYRDKEISTVFDDFESRAIGIPNYVVDPSERDREHHLRQRLGDFMKFDPSAEHSHQTGDRREFYELCLEMVMVRIARVRRALRSDQYELVFGYTSGLDLIGHVAYDDPDMQGWAYEETNDFVGELRADLGEPDELLLVSDHGLQDGLHTEPAMVAGTRERFVDSIASVTDVREAVARELERGDHRDGIADEPVSSDRSPPGPVREQLEDLGYM